MVTFKEGDIVVFTDTLGMYTGMVAIVVGADDRTALSGGVYVRPLFPSERVQQYMQRYDRTVLQLSAAHFTLLEDMVDDTPAPV